MKKMLNLIIIFSVVSCSVRKSEKIEKINFKTEYRLNSEIENEIENNANGNKYQISASEYSNKGDYKNALINWDSVRGTQEVYYTDKQVDSINVKYSKINAHDYIIEQSKKNKIVIINEAHHNSFHRVFTKSLLKKLFENGYKNIGFEALYYEDNLDSLQKIRKYPIQKTGYYTKDPQFGNLIREAIAIGYTVFPYETTNKDSIGKSREIDQAKNISKFIEAHPNDKFLIHCGYDHALEGKHNSWEMAMAERIKEYTGINPFTINQVYFTEKSSSKFNHPFLKALGIKESSVIIDENNEVYEYHQGEAYCDIAVFHPNTEYLDNRPDWLFKNGNKKIAISLRNIEISFPVLVLAFISGEEIDIAVPADVIEVTSKNEACYLGLKKGNYNVVVTNGNQSIKIFKIIK